MKKDCNNGEKTEKSSIGCLLLGLMLYVCMTVIFIYVIRTATPFMCCMAAVVYIFALKGLHIILFGKNKTEKCEEKGAVQDSEELPEQKGKIS